MKIFKFLILFMSIFITIMFSATLLHARILIVSPHPDDDLIISAGIIYKAIQRSEPVTIVYMTNGDINGAQAGYTRQDEAVTGESILGVHESNLIFLGYPDGYLRTVYNDYVDASSQYVSPNGISATYGNRGLGGMDYHSYRFGTTAHYNRTNMLADLQDIFSSFLPDQIFVTSEFDSHPDHSTTYQLVTLAVASVNSSNPAYVPSIHKTIVHWSDGAWPPAAIDPASYYTPIPNLTQDTGLIWADRESIDVPIALQSTDYAANLKYLAIAAHVSQGGTTILGDRIHKEEFFWAENNVSSNHPPIVNAGLDQIALEGQVVQLDGSQSRDPDNTTLSYQWVQRSGVPVQLSNPTIAQPVFTMPTGLSQGEILTFELIVSDGHFTTVPDATNVTVSNVILPGTLTVTPATALTASGVAGGPFSPSSAVYTLQNTGNTAINWSASATQSWATLSSTSGSLAPGASATVTASINSSANSLAAGSYSGTVTFTNTTNANGNTTRAVNLTVTSALPSNIAPLATVTASSETSAYGQTAVKAVDGVISGYPSDYTREWATNGQGVGAWLNLAWPAPYSVNQVVLYDRPNSNDNITSATITFSDGSSIVAGPLNNDGSATTYTFPARVITWLRMTVNGVSGSTQNVGLSEIQAYGTPSGGTQYSLTTNATPTVGGSVTVNPSQSSYYSGTQVTLAAMPNTGYTFSGWSGDATGATNPLTITITGNTAVNANFTAIPGTLTVTPSSGLTSSGAPGGPFSPTSTTYTLQNAGNATINWSASATQSWVTLSSTSSSLAPGASATVTVSINSSANTLTAGSYSDTVTFTNVTNGNGNATRGVSLVITPQYTLTTTSSPSAGGYVTVNPSQSTYSSGQQVTLTAAPNTGYTFSGWSGGATGTTNPLIVTITGNAAVTANFTALPGTLTVTPATALTASGVAGGPFSPSSAVYTLQNTGNTAINWSASATQSWATLSSTSGSLAPGASATVTASINSSANSLAAGSYSGTVTFTNTTNANGNTTRAVNLTVTSALPSNIAPLATVTASSETSAYGQTAVKAVDGVISGYPSDYTREWATNGQGVGAWLNLAWPAPYSVNQVVLYDRPNSNDNITSATITFSDGSSIVAGPLNNDGSATTYTFPARVITWLRMTVNGVSGSTQNVGLSEIQAYGTPSGGTQYSLTTNATPTVGGSVTVNPSQSSYYSGTQVTLAAMPNTGYTFSGWSGDATGATNPLTITITGNTAVNANFTAIPGTLTVTPSSGLTSSGAPGGPFSPTSTTYTLQNAGNATINWSASATQSWVTLSSTSSSLAPGASATVTVSINSSANTLTAGSYSDTVTFTNVTNGNGNATRGVSLIISSSSAVTLNATGTFTPVISVLGSPSIAWTFPGGTPSSSTSLTPGAVTFTDTSVHACTLNASVPSTITSLAIYPQDNGGQAYALQTITGIEKLTGLTNLVLYGAGMTSVPNANQLTSLQRAYFSRNFLGGSNMRWNGLTNLTLVHAYGNNFSAQEVDQLFIDLDNNGVSGGEFSLAYNAGPSAASATARANLAARGNLLTYNTLLSNPGYVPAVSTTGANIQVAGGTRFTVTAPGATDIKVDIQDLGVQHITSGTEVFYYLGNPSQIRNITIEVTPASALNTLTFQDSGRVPWYLSNGNSLPSVPNGNIYSISGLDRFANLQHLAFQSANVLNHISLPNGVSGNLTTLELGPAQGLTSPLAGADADALIASLVAAGSPNGTLTLPNRTAASDANVAVLRARGWSGYF
ncbi:MAG: PIG-L family deacetylase [Desulfuromonadales bacterium]|nr:PIG-L family deacetylase [Desulfuromonadales bacterium]